MRKIGLIAVVAALILVGVGAWMEWVTLDSQARPAVGGIAGNFRSLDSEGVAVIDTDAAAAIVRAAYRRILVDNRVPHNSGVRHCEVDAWRTDVHATSSRVE